MPNVQDGLETGEQRDVNSDAGFLAALASRVGAEVSEGQLAESESHDTSVAAGLTTEESPNRDERGRFAPAATQNEGAAPAEEEHDDLAEYLARHNGDRDAALAAAIKEARGAQSVIGRQSGEVSEARRAQQEMAERLARLEGRLEATSATAPLPVPSQADDTVLEGLESMYAQYGGPAMMNWIANNRPDLIDAGERVWISEDQIGGLDYRSRRIAYETLYDSQRGQQAAQIDPFLDQVRRERQFGAAIDGVRTSLTADEWNTVREHLVPALEDPSTPQIVKDAVVSNDPEVQKQGMSALVDRAWRRAAAAATSQAQNARNEQVRNDKLRAQVATGSLRPVQERKPVQEMSSEERQRLFREALLRTETTSVQDGLTFAKS